MSAVFSRVFMNGNSQAVRIPQEFRLEVGQVQVSRNGDGDLVIRPVPTDRGKAFLQALQAFDDDAVTAEFLAKLSEDQRDAQAPQEREAL